MAASAEKRIKGSKMNANLRSRINQNGSAFSGGMRTFDANNLIEKIKKQIRDQDALVETVVHAMSDRFAQHESKGPLFSVLIVGPPATSKTAFGQALASEYFGSSEAIYDVECAFLANNISALLGTPPGWSGGEGMLTKAVKNRPESVVLIDGLDFLDLRSATPFLTMMLSLLEEGCLTDNRTGEKVDFTKTVIVITSRTQPQEMAKLAADLPETQQAGSLLGTMMDRVNLVATMQQVIPKRRHLEALSTLTDWVELKKLLLLSEKPKGIGIFNADLLIEKIKTKIIDQDVLVETAVHAMSERFARKKRKGPLFSVLLAGPTGTGKTEFAKVIASEYFDAPEAMYRVDCGSLTDGIITSLVGSPQGYQGGGEGLLTKAVCIRPEMVVLFEDIDKMWSTKAFVAMMLSLLDEGYLTDERTGIKVDFTKTVIVITSNAQHQEMAKLAAAFPTAEQALDLQVAVKTALENKPFAPEWLARVQLVTTTQQLTPKGQAKICVLQLKRLADQYSLIIDEKGVDIMVLLQALEVFKKFEGKGARDPMRWVEDKVSKALREAANNGGKVIRLGWDPAGGCDGSGVITAQIVQYDPDCES